MTGYAIVMAMLAVALVAVLVAGAMEERVPRRRRLVVVLAATGEGAPSPASHNWVAGLASALPDDVDVRNLGVGGGTLAEATRSRLPVALDARPDVAVCWLAVNDMAFGVTLADYERDLEALLGRLRAVGARIVLGNVPNLADVPALAHSEHAATLRHATAAWNDAIAEIAARHRATVVDLFAERMTVADFAADGFHPSPTGHRRLATRFLPSVARALAAGASTTGTPTGPRSTARQTEKPARREGE